MHRFRLGSWLFLLNIGLLLLTPAIPCMAQVRANAGNDITVTAGDLVQFNGSGSKGPITRYRWDFGDHPYFEHAQTYFEKNLKALKPGEGPSPTHTYWQPGRYTVALTVFDNRGNSSSDTMVVTVQPNLPPQASIKASIENKLTGKVILDASGSGDPDGDPLSFQWNFSDGTGFRQTTVTHAYDLQRIKAEIGDCRVAYHVTLKATDPHQAEDISQQWVRFDTDPDVASGKEPQPPYLPDQMISVNITSDGISLAGVPAKISVYTGERVFIPLKLKSRLDKAVTIGVLRSTPGNTFARFEPVAVKPGQEMTAPLEIQTLHVYDHAADIELGTADMTARLQIPLQVSIRPFAPLFGGYAHFVRHAAAQLTGEEFKPAGKFVHISLGLRKAAEDMTYLRDYPIQVYRASCQWHVVQRDGPDSYEWRLSDWEIEQAVKNGARVVLTFATGPPQWVRKYDFTNDPQALEYYRRFVEKMVDRYKDKVDFYELSNEPFAFWLRKFIGPKKFDALKKNPQAAREEMDRFTTVIVRASQVAHQIIGERDPTALLLTPGFENRTRKQWNQPFFFTLWKILFEKDIQRYCQRVGVHDFPLWYNAMPPGLDDLQAWRELDQNADSSHLLKVMSQYDVPPALWLTEYGGFRNSDSTEVNQAMAMLHTSAIIAHQRAEGMVTVGLYNYPTDDSPYVYLMKYENHHKTMGFYALKHMISALSGARAFESPKISNSQIIGADYSTLVPEMFNRGNEDIICLWNNGSSTQRVTFQLAPGFTKSHVLELLNTRFSPRGEFYSQQRFSNFSDSERGISFVLPPLDFLVLQMITDAPKFRWLEDIEY